MTPPRGWRRDVNLGRTPPADVPPLPDPRLLTCCLAIDPDPLNHGAVCHQTKGHLEPHDWEPAPSEDDT